MSDKILKFQATWCQPCKMLSKVIEGEDLGIPIEEVDIDEKREVAQSFGIRGVPTMIYTRGGSEVSRVSGMMTLGDVQKWISSVK